MDRKEKEDKARLLYGALRNLVMHAEDVRWVRLNALLVVNTLLILTWAAVFTMRRGEDAQPIRGYLFVLISLCVLGILFSSIWGWLGKRTSEYLNGYHDAAMIMEWYVFENCFKASIVADESLKIIFEDEDKIEEVKGKGLTPYLGVDRGIHKELKKSFFRRWTSSVHIVTWVVPGTFALLFAFLIVVSVLSAC